MMQEVGERFANAVELSQLKTLHVADLMNADVNKLRSWLTSQSLPSVYMLRDLVQFISTMEAARDLGLFKVVRPQDICPRLYRSLWVAAGKTVDTHELFFGVSPLFKSMIALKVKSSDIEPYIEGYSGSVMKVVRRKVRTRKYLDAFVRVALVLKVIQDRGGFTEGRFDSHEFETVHNAIKHVALPLRN